MLGIDLGGTHLRLALAHISGELRARWSASTVGIRDPHHIVSLIAMGSATLLSDLGLPREALRSVAVGAPGVTDVDRGIVIATSYLLGWRDVPLRSLLEAALHIPAVIDNDVNVATLAESWAGAAQHTPDFGFLAIGTGVGAGIFLRGALLRGSGWLAGEIGYMLVPGVSEAAVAEDAPGALESIAGGHAIQARWRALARDSTTPMPEDLSATQIFDLAGHGHPAAAAVLAETARVLAYAVYNLCLVIDIPLVIFGGGVGVHPGLINEVQAQLANRHAHVTPRVRASTLGPDAQLLGVVRFAVELAERRMALHPYPRALHVKDVDQHDQVCSSPVR